jgi:DNA-binding NtrC family response regulator
MHAPRLDVDGLLAVGDRHIVALDPRTVHLFRLVRERLAHARMPVLVEGETGTGKELVAAALHAWSDRACGPFVALNCAAIPEHLLESELFGCEEGAYSGASRARAGLIEAAHGGVLFLDEIGELPLTAQAKLLRVLESKRVRRLGDVNERTIDIRIVAATNRDLAEEVTQERFRKDLFFRLKGAIVKLLPLRERPEELRALSRFLLDEACRQLGRAVIEMQADALARLLSYDWPGNVRELESFADWVAAVAEGNTLEEHHLDEWIGNENKLETCDLPAVRTLVPPSGFRPIAEEIAGLEKRRMQEALASTAGNRTRAAALIQMPMRTFSTKLRLYGLIDPAEAT